MYPNKNCTNHYFSVKVQLINTLIFFVLGAFSAFAQQLVPPIHTYSTVDYKAASQNWNMAIDDEGMIYSANNQGLLSFDGQQWELHPLKNGSIIRSVYAHGDRIYTGSYREFGYWSRDNTGKMEYTSLIPLLGDYELQSEEFWEILSFKDAIYFRSFRGIYKYQNDTIKPVRNVISNKMTEYKDRLLISVGKSGLFFLDEDGEMEALPGQEILKDQVVVDIAVKEDRLFLGTREALYEYEGEKSRLYPDNSLKNDLEKFELNHIMVINNDELVLATVKNGIIHYNTTTGESMLYNRKNGLQNNTVLGVAEKDGNIWLGLDNGINRINFNSPTRFYTDDSGELGAVYDLNFFENELFLGSNTGVYRFNNNKPEIIEGAGGHTWNLKVLDNKLYANHNTGTFEIIDGSFSPVEERTGSFQVSEVPGRELNLISTYTGLTGVPGEKNEVFTVEGVNFPIKKVLFENEFVLWAAHPYEGIYRIRFDDNFKSAESVTKVEDIDGNGHYKADIFKINNQLAIFNDNKWYRYNSFSDSLQVFKELDRFCNHKLLHQDHRGFWFANTSNNSLVFTDLKGSNAVITATKLQNRLVKEYERVIRYNDSIYYVTLNDGFARVNLNQLLKSKEEEFLSTPVVRGFFDRRNRYDLTTTPEVEYNDSREVKIRTALPVSDAAGLKYRLVGSDTLQGKVEKGEINFQNLPHGDYRVDLFAVSSQNNPVEKVSFGFVINPPWYLSNMMKAVYLLLFLCLIGLIYWFNKLKLKKQHLLLEQKFEKEHKERLNQLEKQRLMNEITLKRKELANTTMVAAKKNEVLMEIQGELNKDKSKFSNQFRLKHIMNKINKAVKNKDEWQVFETNFNELHEDFFKDVLESYPKLSNKDLKLCSYLKMNLTSKEIAPLMGISVRGVEVHRYRLRKKMGLDKKENLTNFLIKNF